VATLIHYLENQIAQKGKSMSNATQRILLKEVLQSYVLSFLYNHKEYRKLNFYGGTCLRVIYNLNRMSEDIDLDNSDQLNLDQLEADLLNYFRISCGVKFMTSTSQKSHNQIHRITLKFPVLYLLNLSSHENENLHLKVEISQHIQRALIQKTPMLYYGKSFIPNHFSIETMMAGKILACLERNFQVGTTNTDFKARDFYDLLWMMQQKIVPYLDKLQQDGNQAYTIQTAFKLLKDRVKRIDPRVLKRDLGPLFENQVFIEMWCESFHDNFSRFSKHYVSN